MQTTKFDQDEAAYIPGPKVRARYNVTDMTIHRCLTMRAWVFRAPITSAGSDTGCWPSWRLGSGRSLAAEPAPATSRRQREQWPTLKTPAGLRRALCH